MKILKGITLGLLSFLLFILLSVFGIVFTVHQVALNPNFITGVINDIDFTEIARETINQEQSGEPLPEDLKNAIINTIDSIQPVIKNRMAVAIKETYGYMQGRGNELDLKTVLGDSFMNSATAASFLENIDLSQLVDQFLQEQSTNSGDASSQDLQKAMVATIDRLEPALKTQIVAASDPIFKYLLQQSPSINVKQTIRQTFLSRDFVTTLVDNLDIKLLTQSMLKDQIGQLPQGISLNAGQIGQILIALEPSVKTGLKSAADPIADYLVGTRQDFSVSISLQPAMTDIKNVVKFAFSHQQLPDLQGLTQEQVNAAVDAYWAIAQASIPSSFELNSTMFGTGIASSMNEAFTSMQDGLAEARRGIDEATTEAENRLADARQYVRMFQLVYIGFIALMLLIVLAIVLIHRSVKGATLNLGIILLAYGVLFFIGIFVARIFIKQIVLDMEMPVESLRSLVQHIMSSLTSPLFMFSLACVIVGVVLLVVSIVYPRMRTREVQPVVPPEK
jgi:hypothetical protein